MKRLWAIALLVTAGGWIWPGAAAAARPKKLIQYGWEKPSLAWVRNHIQVMEQRPFDGIILRLVGFGHVFTVTQWEPDKFTAAANDLSQIRWGTFTDNFLVLYSNSNMDWFSDADWNTVTHNVGLMAQAAVAGHCKGLFFDPEPYGTAPWSYAGAPHAGDKSFAEYEAQVRKRGAQYMRAIAQQMPQAVVLAAFLLSYVHEVGAEPDPAVRARLLSQHQYGLLPAFVNGLLDGATPQMVIVDGNERAYNYRSPRQFSDSARDMHETVLSLVAPENRDKYRRLVQAGQSIFVDRPFDMDPGVKSAAAGLSPGDRMRWFEQNAYYALTTSDEYAWCFSEHMDWWQDVYVPAGLAQAIVTMRNKVASGEPLGFDLSSKLGQTH